MRIGMIVTTVLQAASIGERSARDRLPRTTLLAISNYPFDLTGSYCIAMHSKESIPLFSIRGFSLAEGDHFSGSVVQNCISRSPSLCSGTLSVPEQRV